MNKGLKAIKKHSIRLISHPTIAESGVYDAVFEVNGEMVEREFEVGVIADYEHEDETNSSHLEHVAVSAICCNEDDEDLASIMECKMEEAIEDYMRSWGTNEKSKGYGI